MFQTESGELSELLGEEVPFANLVLPFVVKTHFFVVDFNVKYIITLQIGEEHHVVSRGVVDVVSSVRLAQVLQQRVVLDELVRGVKGFVDLVELLFEHMHCSFEATEQVNVQVFVFELLFQ